MAYTLAEFAKLDLNLLRQYDKNRWRSDSYGTMMLGGPPEGELFLPAPYECSNCLGDGYNTFLSIFEETCQACQGTGVIH